jgi:hypothetical protein
MAGGLIPPSNAGRNPRGLAGADGTGLVLAKEEGDLAFDDGQEPQDPLMMLSVRHR